MRSQAARTAQAWARTALGVVGLALWGFRLEVEQGGPAILLAVLTLVAAGTFAVLGHHRSVQLLEPRPRPLPASMVRMVAVAVVAIDAAGLALVLNV